MSRYHKAPVTEPLILDPVLKLPLDRQVAVYYRQSTLAQVGNVSTAIQTVDMVDYCERLGWKPSQVVLIDMDEGVSGTLKIDERTGMRHLFDLINSGNLGAVACQDEDRLFRDVTQIQVNIFIEACRAAAVLVLTPSMMYDFAHPLHGTYHARQFRFKCEMAAEYINSVIRGKLQRARMRLLMEGRWAGAGTPPGFMVDMRKTLPNGSTNEQWRRFVPFGPYAEVVNEYFQLFLSYAGSIRTTVRHIQEEGPYYPDPQSCPPPEGFKANYKMFRYSNGYCPARTGLIELLTNAAYLGHWAVKDTIVRWNNHEPLVPEDVFMRAFNYLSSIGLDGRPNPHYRPLQRNARPSVESHRPVDRPICAGLLFSYVGGRWRKVGTTWDSQLQRYNYTAQDGGPFERLLWARKATNIDDLVCELAQEKLRATFEAGAWEEAVNAFSATYEKERHGKRDQLTSLEQVMQNLLASLDTLRNPQMIQAAEARYEAAQEEYNRLTADLVSTETEMRLFEAVQKLKETYAPALDNWPNLNTDEKRILLHAFVTRIEANPLENKALHLIIQWRDGSCDEITVRHRGNKSPSWLPDETRRLLELVDSGASQIEIAREFADLKWKRIENRIRHERGSFRLGTRPIKPHETYRDYLTHKDKDSLWRHWSSDEAERLAVLIRSGATQIEIAREFPDRTWRQIRDKVRAVTGKRSLTSSERPIKTLETYRDYLKRVGLDSEGEEGDQVVVDDQSENIVTNVGSVTCSEKVHPYETARFPQGEARLHPPPSPRARWCGAGRETGGAGESASRREAGPRRCRCWSHPTARPASCAAGWRAANAPSASCPTPEGHSARRCGRQPPRPQGRAWRAPAP
jgi:hypothetical protein